MGEHSASVIGEAFKLAEPASALPDSCSGVPVSSLWYGARAPRLWLLDRDGVLNERARDGYVIRLRDWRTLQGVEHAIRIIRCSGAWVATVTNQACIGKGLVSPDTVEAIHRRFESHLHQHGGKIDRFYVCPHRPEDRCSCRKPQPGLVFRALEEFAISPDQALLVGDSNSDLEAAERAGVCGIHAVGDGGLLAVVQKILRFSGAAVGTNCV